VGWVGAVKCKQITIYKKFALVRGAGKQVLGHTHFCYRHNKSHEFPFAFSARCRNQQSITDRRGKRPLATEGQSALRLPDLLKTGNNGVLVFAYTKLEYKKAREIYQQMLAFNLKQKN